MPFINIHSESTEDQNLIRLYQTTRDLEHVGALFGKYMLFVYGVCLRYFTEEAAKDATMQIFEELAEKLKTHEVHHFKSWLHVLTRNYCLMQLRDTKRKEGHLVSLEEKRIMEKEDFYHPDRDGSADDGLVLEENLQVLEGCMKMLNEPQRRSVDLFYLQEKSYQEIVSETGYDLKKVKSYIQNGKRNLKICLEKKTHGL